CLWQIEVTQAVLQHDHDNISISMTSSGKMLTFGMPLLFHPQEIQIVVTPLNIFSTQNVAALDKLCIKGLALHAENSL
ncbi:uncharacterized protein F5891DRAFT_938968, partial [Suillus fuscotomentosus]